MPLAPPPSTAPQVNVPPGSGSPQIPPGALQTLQAPWLVRFAGNRFVLDAKTLASLLFLAVGAALLFLQSMGRNEGLGPAFVCGLGGGYVMWCLFWGVPPSWRWWQSKGYGQALTRNVKNVWLKYGLFLGLLFTVVTFYSVMGGGIFHFIQHQKALRGVP